MRKLYGAYILIELASYFEEKLNKHGVRIVDKKFIVLEGIKEVVFYYILEAEEGVIDSKWELK